MKKVLLLTLLVFLFSFCLFASPSQSVSSTSFVLKHLVNVDGSYHFEFWSPITNGHITEVAINEAGTTVIATLMIIFNTGVDVPRLSITFTDLVNDEGLFYPYTLEILKPNSREQYAQTMVDETSHGAGSAILFESRHFARPAGEGWFTDEICDFAITLDDSQVPVGSYTGNLRFIQTTE